MQQQIKQKRWHAAEKWIWLFLPIGFLMGVLLGRHLIFDFVQLYFPPCVFYTVTHFYCPGCGNTRTVLACCTGILCRHCTIMQRFVICWWYCCCCICKKCCVALENRCSYCRKEIGFRLFPFAFAWHIV